MHHTYRRCVHACRLYVFPSAVKRIMQRYGLVNILTHFTCNKCVNEGFMTKKGARERVKHSFTLESSPSPHVLLIGERKISVIKWRLFTKHLVPLMRHWDVFWCRRWSSIRNDNLLTLPPSLASIYSEIDVRVLSVTYFHKIKRSLEMHPTQRAIKS